MFFQQQILRSLKDESQKRSKTTYQMPNQGTSDDGVSYRWERKPDDDDDFELLEMNKLWNAWWEYDMVSSMFNQVTPSLAHHDSHAAGDRSSQPSAYSNPWACW